MIEFYTEDEKDFVISTSKFEELHPEELRWTKKERQKFFKEEDGNGIQMFYGGILVGELLWSIAKMDKTAYIASFSIDKNYWGCGYGLLLRRVYLNMMLNFGYKYVIGHAKNGSSWHIAKKTGAKLIKTEKNWGGTGEKYYYYKQKL